MLLSNKQSYTWLKWKLSSKSKLKEMDKFGLGQQLLIREKTSEKEEEGTTVRQSNGEEDLGSNETVVTDYFMTVKKVKYMTQKYVKISNINFRFPYSLSSIKHRIRACAKAACAKLRFA